MIFSSFVLLSGRVAAQSGAWEQCGGIGFTGSTDCVAGYTCVYENDWWSMCEPGSAAPAPTPEPTEELPAPAPTPVEDPSEESSSSSSESSSSDSEDTDGAVEPELWSSTTFGEGTFYGDYSLDYPYGILSDGTWPLATGHCSYSNVYDSTPGDSLKAFAVDNYVAVGKYNSYDGSLACGMCVEYESDDPTIGSGTALVVDSCEACAEGDLDFLRQGTGRFDVSWKAVDCPVAEQKLEYAFVEGVSEWYLKMQIRNHKVPVALVELMHNGEYQEMVKGMDNHWIAGSNFTPDNLPPPYETPLKFRITSVMGEVVYDTVEVTPAELSGLNYFTPVTGTKQFVQDSPTSS